MKIESKQKGFTLIELMIVVAIIGILASIAIPQFAQFRVKAFDAAGSADLKNGTTAIEAVYTEAYAYPIDTAGSVTATAKVWTSTLSWSASNGVLLGHKGTASSYALATKHKGGKFVYTKTRTGQHSETTVTNFGEGVDITATQIPTAN